MNMQLSGYTYKRFPDSKGGQVHVVETRLGRFQSDSKEGADRLAWMAERADQLAAERREELAQIAREEQAAALAFTDARGR